MTALLARWTLSLYVVFFAVTLRGQEAAQQDQRYVVDIELQTAQEFQQLLERAEQLLLAGVELPRDEASVTFVLHGPVLRNLLRQNYLDNKRLVDMAASLSALGVIEVMACRAWMGSHNMDENELQPFVEPVAYGPAVVEELLAAKDHVYF